MPTARRLLLTAVAAWTGLALAACGSDSSPASSGPDGALVLYNAQHDEVGKAWADGFTAKTGIKVDIRNGSDFELANQIVAEGESSPADVFITENSPAMSLVSAKGLFAPVDAATRAQVPARYSSGKGDWVGVAARSTVFIYNPGKIPAADLPKSIIDLARPEWKGRYAVSPSGADFQAVVSAVYALRGQDEGRAWLQGIKDNARILRGNNTILRAVNAGEIEGGVTYHYYWYRDQADGGANSSKVKLEFFGEQDPGAFVSVSGGGVLQSSSHPTEAQRFLAYMTGPEGQQLLADGDALEYTVGSGIPANARLTPLDQLDAPTVDPNTLNGPTIVTEMQEVGLL
ncbi:iron ABC transporter substrate-binding protein [Parafrankia sp. EUN1f]|uniref:iron ABC transporter substrate-binding protein n=1 Tax=Parafrankia sp. EUN1f TaxID=102897 RepID=UPI0001C46BF8|nr:iron ABC transporter substrate-binding protein [Parafrankia sp. EUN1f]EFC80842.1 extracellular solute-binding protein family 1 [Parafrankia sp. EUN1f]